MEDYHSGGTPWFTIIDARKGTWFSWPSIWMWNSCSPQMVTADGALAGVG